MYLCYWVIWTEGCVHSCWCVCWAFLYLLCIHINGNCRIKEHQPDGYFGSCWAVKTCTSFFLITSEFILQRWLFTMLQLSIHQSRTISKRPSHKLCVLCALLILIIIKTMFRRMGRCASGKSSCWMIRRSVMPNKIFSSCERFAFLFGNRYSIQLFQS